MANNVEVTNLTRVTQHVGVIHADGKRDAVQIMARKRVGLRDGMTVDPRWLGLNPGAVTFTAPEVPSKAPAVVTKGAK